MIALAEPAHRPIQLTSRMTTRAAVEIRGLQKRFGRAEVLRNVDLDIVRGRVTAVVGPNGAGKSTLLKSIIGLVRPDAGTIRVDGNLVVDDDSYRSCLGYMPQIARYPHGLTGAELISLLCELRCHSESGAPMDEELIDRFQLRSELAKPLRSLSGGTRQKVNAVAAFLFAPRILILDEPTAGLDPISSGTFKDKILSDRSDGRTIVVASHIMSDLQELADDIVVLLDGRVQYSGTVNDLLDLTHQRSLERAIARLMRGVGALKGEPLVPSRATSV